MLRVNINYDKLNTEERRLKAGLVADEMQLILNSDLFKEKFLAIADYHGELSKWKDATITEIFAYLMNGSEILSPDIDGEIDLFVDDYYTPKRVIGHTYDSDRFIYTNTKYFDTYSTKLVGSNFLHEYGHKKGFDHDFKSTARRDFSLCYLLNDIYERTWDELLGDPSERDKVLVCTRSWRTLFFQRCRWIKVKDAEPIPV